LRASSNPPAAASLHISYLVKPFDKCGLKPQETHTTMLASRVAGGRRLTQQPGGSNVETFRRAAGDT
jgi:hypothetical protein